MIVSTIRSWFAWETVRDTGVHWYQVNRVTNKRRILSRGAGRGYQPKDTGWLETGEWTPRPRPPAPMPYRKSPLI